MQNCKGIAYENSLSFVGTNDIKVTRSLIFYSFLLLHQYHASSLYWRIFIHPNISIHSQHVNFDPQSSTKNITVQLIIASRLISPNSQYSYPIPNCHKLLFATRELPFLFTFPGYLFHPCHHVHRPAYKPRHESSVKKKRKKKKMHRVSSIDPKSITPLEYYSPNYRLEDPRPRAIRGLLHKASKQAGCASGRADGLNAIIGSIRI